MKITKNKILTISALAGLSLTTAQAATISWTGAGSGENWDTTANWDAGRAPVNGDSVVLNGRTVLNYDFTVTSGQSITDTGSNWLGLSNNGWGSGTVANLTLATGGSIDAGYIAARGNTASSHPSFTIESGATLTSDSINDTGRSMALIWEADAVSITTWNTGNITSLDDFSVNVDITDYTAPGVSSLTLVDYSGTLGTEFASVIVTDGAETLVNGVDYTLSYGSGSNDSITLTMAAVPEPSSTALLGLGGLALILRRRK